MNDSVFTKIINREIPAEIIWEDNDFIAFLDINPFFEGHTLLVPKKQIDKFYELEDELASKIFVHAKKLSIALEKTYNKQRIAMVIKGFEVPHVHIHLLPINQGDHLDTGKENIKTLTAEELKIHADKIRQNIDF